LRADTNYRERFGLDCDRLEAPARLHEESATGPPNPEEYAMRKIRMQNRISIDGFFASLNKKTNGMEWFVQDPAIEKAAHKLGKADTLILGKDTFLLFQRTWMPMLTDSKAPPPMKKLAQELTKMKKIVFSTTVKATDWENTIFHDSDLIGVVKKLKRQNGADIMIMGSGSIVQQLTKAGLIDEYAFIVTPIIAGVGKPLFQDVSPLELELMSTKHFASGNVLSHFRAA
jgi:dihydrofolate reductase